MRLNVANINRIIQVNNLPEVTNPIYLDSNMTPTSDGLYSYEMFGRANEPKRRLQFAWINLNRKFIHPFAYKAIKTTFRGIDSLVMGDQDFRIVKGRLVKADDGDTGLDFFIRNRKAISFGQDEGTKSRRKRVGLLESLSNDEMFIDKFLVIPPFYRDINLDRERLTTDEISDMYKRLISLCGSIDPKDEDPFTGHMTNFKVQTLLNELYGTLTKMLSGKRGVIRRSLLGKSIDYAARLVISGPKMDSNTHEEVQIPYGYIGIPLHVVLVMAFPFVLNRMESFFSDFKNHSVCILGAGDKREKVETIQETVDDMTTKSFERLVNLYARGTVNRTRPMEIRFEKGKKTVDIASNLGRPFTLTDFFFGIARRIVRNKHAMVTRYPLEDYRNIAPLKVRVLTLERTKEVKLRRETILDYPDLDMKNPEANRWIDSARPHPSYLPGWGGDFDGDMVSIKLLYTEEANKEAEDLIRKPMTLLDISGKPSRGFAKEPQLSLYALTK